MSARWQLLAKLLGDQKASRAVEGTHVACQFGNMNLDVVTTWFTNYYHKAIADGLARHKDLLLDRTGG